ncbi:paramyosin-like isoform X3 [Biomphalaria glabrata]|uniref:Paramyosin-like isoform X3 n=1 Tax=Biomphalaria glabrata TaxID=6526 RepID=A0A9W3AWS9_BIOGL|nr:paramyosin-like isoform X3 [Biomphalaria glabrata]
MSTMMWEEKPLSTVTDNFEILASNSFSDCISNNEDVEKLLRSTSPTRQRSLSLRSRPPSGRAYLKSFSRSPSPSRIKQMSSTVSIRESNKWQEDWRNALEKAVDEPEIPQRLLPTSSDSVLDSNSDWFPMKANHEITVPTDNIGIYKTRKPFVYEDMNLIVPTKLSRSQSMSTLNKSMNGDVYMNGMSVGSGLTITDKSMQDLHNTLEDSENRRNVLIHKLKEAQSTLELQNERLNKIESSAKENSLLVEDLKMKERAYRKKIHLLEAGQEEKQRLKMDNLRLREEMQARISTLDNQLKQLKTQHNSSESENDKRAHLLNHTTTILSLLEEENAKLHQDKEKLLSEFTLTKEALNMTKANYSGLEIEHNNLKNECIRFKEDNTALARKVQEMAGQMLELRSLLQAVRDENERITSTWRTTAEDKVQVAKQVEGYKDMISDLKSRLATTSTDRDRLFQEKLEMNSKIQQMVLDKEQLMRAKLNLEDQVNNPYPYNSSLKFSDYRQDLDKHELTKELAAVKKVCDELTTELSSVKLYYERSLEQVSALEKSRLILQSQLDIGDQEKLRLQLEIDRLNQLQRERNLDEKNGRDFQEEQIFQLRNEIKNTRFEKSELEAKILELEAKLMKAHEGLREETVFQTTELDMWKNTCERVTSSLANKESELQNITDRVHQLEDIVLDLRKKLRDEKDKNEILSTKFDDSERLKSENKRLLQEKSENEQVIKLLETQKSVLTKASEDGLSRNRQVENLKEQVNQLRNENEMLRKNKAELEKQKEKDPLMVRSNIVEDADIRIEEVQKANKELRQKNEDLMLKLDAVNQENARIRQALNETESDSLRNENMKLRKEIESLKKENQVLNSQHQDGDVIKDSPDVTKLRKEKDAMQKQVALLQGQMNLVEGSKKRAEDQVSRLNAELNEMRAKMNQVNTSHNPPLEAELRKEVEILKHKLEKAGEDHLLQESLINKLTEQQKGDNVEHNKLTDKIKGLELEVDQKKKLLTSLENQLKLAESQAHSREQEIKQLNSTVKELESDNQKLNQEVQEKKNTPTITPKFNLDKPTYKKPEPKISLQEELADVLKSKQNGFELQRSSPLRSKSLSHADLKSPSSPSEPGKTQHRGHYGGMFFVLPEKAATDGSTKLQSLISKYRNHSDTEESSQPLANKPGTPKIVFKNRFSLGAVKSPSRLSSETSSTSEGSIPSPEVAADSPTSPDTKSTRPVKKLPPEPLPKPASPLMTWTKSTFMRAASAENGGKDSDRKLATPAILHATFPAASNSQRSLSSSGIGLSLGDSEDLNDSQEQKDINALIQKEQENTENKILRYLTGE